MIRACQSIISIVDDDIDVRKALHLLFTQLGYTVQLHANGLEFLNQYDPDLPGCIISDIRMPIIGGLELQERLNALGYHCPLIFMTGHGDVSLAVRTLKQGAFDFIEKPFQADHLQEVVRHAIVTDLNHRQFYRRNAILNQRLEKITRREQEILDRIVAGQSNKTIAYELGTSIPTIETHRKHIMEKMQARNLPHLVQMVLHARASEPTVGPGVSQLEPHPMTG